MNRRDMRNCLLSALLSLLTAFPATATASEAAVATAHPLATQAGVKVLRQGGNAFDAAIAVTAALAVVEPFGSGLGGGGFWLLHLAEEGRNIVIDGRETAPEGAGPRVYQGLSGAPVKERSRDGPLSAAIPGVPAALDHLAARYSCLSLGQNLAPAVDYARNGFAVTERYRFLAGYRKEVMQRYRHGAEVFLDDGAVPELGHVIVQDDLADTLELIADRGASAFYTGKLAVKMVRAVRRAGGIWRISDLSAYRVKEREPVTSSYKGMRIVSVPPPSAGGVVMSAALGILEHVPQQDLERDPEHYIVEAMRAAWLMRALHLGDPDFSSIPVERLLDREHLRQLAANIGPTATPSEEMAEQFPQGENTTHFSIVDSHGNRVAATLSINLPFGSGFMVPGTGIILNNEMDDFSMKARAPNAYGLVSHNANLVAPGRRPLSSMSPTFLEQGGRVAVLGTPGGGRIISMVLLAALGFHAGQEPTAVVAAPRYHHQFLPDEIQHEPGAFSEGKMQRLQQLGHGLRDVGRKYGNMHLIEMGDGKMVAASDPRGEGEATVFSIAPQAAMAACQR